GHRSRLQLRAAPLPATPFLHLSDRRGARRARRRNPARVEPRRSRPGRSPDRHAGSGGLRGDRRRHGGARVRAASGTRLSAYGGGGSQGVLLHAAAAVSSGAARVVVVYRAIEARSGARFGRAQVAGRPTSAHSGSTAAQWCSPYGVLTPASWIALNATRYMH